MKKDNHSYLESNSLSQRNKALEALAKAKEVEAKKIASGKKWVKIDGKTEVLK